MHKSHRISVNLSEEEYSNLQKIAETHRLSLAWIGRQAISDFLSAYQNEQATTLPPFGEVGKDR